jgi:hypothetical protein
MVGHEDQIKVLDRWIADQGEDISRPEAIRRLVEMALKKPGKP